MRTFKHIRILPKMDTNDAKIILTNVPLQCRTSGFSRLTLLVAMTVHRPLCVSDHCSAPSRPELGVLIRVL